MTPQQFLKAQQRVDTEQGRIAYIDQGIGPATLFVHGLPLCSYHWRHVFAAFGTGRRLIAPDVMGLGYSEVPAGQDVSFASQARMLTSLLDRLGIDTVDVVGSDTGGGIAQIFAANDPSRVRSLSLLNCEVFDRWPNALLTGFYQSVVAGQIIEAMRVMLSDAAFGQQQLGALVYEDPAIFSADNIALYLKPLLESDRRIAQFEQLADWQTNRAQLVDVAGALRALEVPTQVLWGDGDGVFDTEPSLVWLRENLGGLRQIVRIPGAKLFFAEEHAPHVASLLTQFWDLNRTDRRESR